MPECPAVDQWQSNEDIFSMTQYCTGQRLK